MKRGIPSKKDFAEWVENIAYNDTIKNMIWATQASLALSQKEIDAFEKMYSEIDTGYTYLLDRLMLEYQMTLEKINHPEAISFSITGKPTDMNYGKTELTNNLLSQIITSNSGKVTYIDIGALWCSPCRTVLEQIKPLSEKYAGKDVAFSLICMGGEKEEWNNILLEKGLTGIPNHLTSKEEDQILRNTFGMFPIPYGILVNKKGIIVDYGTHIRPGMGLQNKIDHLLEHDRLLD
jgi:thiol-disulfide isomerase/thioredoxin